MQTRRQAGDDGTETDVDGGGPTRDLESYRERIAGTWDDDPLVLAFTGAGLPVVAAVGGELRYLSYHITRPRRVDERDLEKFIAVRGQPQVVPLSEHPAGYDPRLFRLDAL
ncbi:MAG: hypothetical protein ACOCSF_03355 [Halanaeroarchaeum sp.]